VEAWYRAGETEAARKAAKRYLKRFPKGPRTDAVRSYGGF